MGDKFINYARIGLLAIAMAALTPSAQATISFTNGNFATNGGVGQVGFNTTVTGWTAAGYTFLFTSPSEAHTTGGNGDSGNVKLQTVGSTLPNSGPNALGTVTNFVGTDAAYEGPGSISQSISGLTNGVSYTVGFYWAAGEQLSIPGGAQFSGANNEGWTVGLGSSATKTTSLVTPTGTTGNVFAGWFYQQFTFVADGPTDLLKFLADGGPDSSAPPFVLLTDVTFSQTVPEPATWSMMLGGFGLLGFGILKSKRRNKS